jgi:hypothetical protein
MAALYIKPIVFFISQRDLPREFLRICLSFISEDVTNRNVCGTTECQIKIV